MTTDIVLVLATSVVPIAERGAIALGIGLKLSPILTYVLVITGNMTLVWLLLFFLANGSQWAMARFPWIKQILERVFAHTRARHGHRFETFGFGALVVLVALPTPLTGVWTASVVSYLINMPIKKAFFAILIGASIANAITLAAVLGILKII